MKNHSTSLSAHITRAAITSLLVVASISMLAIASSNAGARSKAGAVQPSPDRAAQPNLTPTTFTGTFDPHAYPCSSQVHDFTVPANQARIVVEVNANVPTNDITVTLLFGSTLIQTQDTGVGQEVINYAPGGTIPGGVYHVQVCESANPAAPLQQPLDYTGIFAYDDTNIGTPPPPTGSLSPAPTDNGPKIGYEVFEPPASLTQSIVTSSGGVTVEYLGRYAIEPSIGANWSDGTVAYQSDLETLFVTFDDSLSLTNPRATWVNRPAQISVLVDSDPILFTDRVTNRTFVSSLTLLGPSTAKNAYTDNNGMSWVPDQTGGIASAVDHQTIGGGRYHDIAGVPVTNPIYPNAIYYCSQDIAFASCGRSDDGGLTYGPAVPMYALASCEGLHGHVKVSPADGTVYIPNRSCGTSPGIVVSEDNGNTWTVRPVQTATQSAATSTVGQGDDPALSVDAAGKVYFAFSNFSSQEGVAVSGDQGQTWTNMYDIGASFGLHNVCFPAATAGDSGRAAIAFYGSKISNSVATGDSNDGTFRGVWHLYVAHTFDGGATWTTSDLTPTMPMQRSGLLRGGGADAWRNLADFFDMTIDKDGRVLVGFGNGCEGGPCAQAPVDADGSNGVIGSAYSATASIARQSSGRRMLASQNPPLVTRPGLPFVTQVRKASSVSLMWNESDTGNSPILNYSILRGFAPNTETLLTTVTGTQIGGSYLDNTANDPTKTYYYKVVANNLSGSSAGSNEIAAPYIGDTCNGLIIHRNLPNHPESTGGGSVGQPPTPQLLIDYIAVAEPPSTSNIKFTMKVSDLSSIPPNSRWRISWNWFNPVNDPDTTPQIYYIGMKSDQNSDVTYEYGTFADAGVPAVLILSETMLGSAVGTNSPDGTLTFTVPRAAIGNPQPGNLLGAIAGKTITGDTPGTGTLERSTTFIDHTFIKGTTDTAFPAATYTITGNAVCTATQIVPVGAVSRKTHGSAGDFDIDLPLTGNVGIEDRTGGPSGNHRIVVTFASPVQVNGAPQATVTSGTGSVSNVTVNNTTVTIDLTGVTNAQTITVALNNVTDGTNSGNVGISMGVLVGDTTADRAVNSADVSQTKSQSGQFVTNLNFREDVVNDGALNSADVSLVKSKSGTALP